MWWFWGTILAAVVVFTLVGIVVERRRGPTGPNARSLDFNKDNRAGHLRDGDSQFGPGTGGA